MYLQKLYNQKYRGLINGCDLKKNLNILIFIDFNERECRNDDEEV